MCVSPDRFALIVKTKPVNEPKNWYEIIEMNNRHEKSKLA